MSHVSITVTFETDGVRWNLPFRYIFKRGGTIVNSFIFLSFRSGNTFALDGDAKSSFFLISWETCAAPQSFQWFVPKMYTDTTYCPNRLCPCPGHSCDRSDSYSLYYGAILRDKPVMVWGAGRQDFPEETHWLIFWTTRTRLPQIVYDRFFILMYFSFHWIQC